MNRLVRATLVLIFAAVLVAGCANTNQPGDGGTSPTGGTPATGTMTPAEAQGLLSDASREMPDRFGMDLSVRAGGKDMLTMKGSVDNSTGETYFEIKGDPSAFGEEAAMGGEFLQQGLVLYATKDGSLYLANGTAFVFPPSDDGEPSGGFLPDPSESPFGDFLDPAQTIRELEENNITVKSVTPTTLRGKAAIEMVIEGKDDNQTMTATVIVFRTPARLAHLETTIPADPEDPANPLAGGTATIDLYYDDEVESVPSEAAKRALGLVYKSNKNAFDFGGSDDGPTVWTFQVSGGVALADVEAQVKDASQSGDSETPDPKAMPTLWSLKLSEGSKTQDGVTIAFADNDADGKVSKGDTLTITGQDESGVPPQVVLYDTVTGTYVVPGAGLALVLAALGALALALRRK